MIRTTATVDTAPIDDLMHFIASQNAMVADIGREVIAQYGDQALSHLQAEPPSPKYPLQWASERQRKFVMAMLRKNNNLPYQRTHELSQAWVIKDLTENGVFSIVIENPAKAAKFVYGSLAKNESAAGRFQQKMHKATGWQSGSVTANYWMNVMKDAFIERYHQRIAEFGRAGSGRTRAYTGGTRR